mmetsp:Transcript_11287/g.27659  ORF Transcript_11287/g.27659 Transcript_11287/m.27659 type:complete len:279 (-) Transcript_11287:904-1740(-)
MCRPASWRCATRPYKRVGSLWFAMCCFTSLMATSRRWKMPAASAAEQAVALNTCVKCSGLPAPLDAMTGMVTAPLTARTRSRSKPWPTPSLSMQLSRISPAPSAATARASSTAPTSRPSRPPLTVHCHQQYSSPLGPRLSLVTLTVWCLTSLGSLTHTRRGSMDTTTACRPYTALICSMLVLPVSLPVLMYSSATSTASLPMDTLSAPDRKYAAATSSALYSLPLPSLKPRMPPPMVSGTNTRSLACCSTCSMGRSLSGKSRKPVMLRKVTSSAPSSK